MLAVFDQLKSVHSQYFDVVEWLSKVVCLNQYWNVYFNIPSWYLDSRRCEKGK